MPFSFIDFFKNLTVREMVYFNIRIRISVLITFSMHNYSNFESLEIQCFTEFYSELKWQNIQVSTFISSVVRK